jgi:hypothetical protein
LQCSWGPQFIRRWNWNRYAETQLAAALFIPFAGPRAGLLLARLRDLDTVTAAYAACRKTYPEKKILLCQSGRIVRRSDRDDAEVQTLR